MNVIVRTTKNKDFMIDKSYQIFGEYQEVSNGLADENLLYSLKVSNNEAHLNVEDDLIVSKRFWEIANDRIGRYPNNFISFFTLRNITADKWIRGKEWLMFQCLYIPKGHSNDIIAYYPTYLQSKRYKDLSERVKNSCCDSFVSEYLASKKIKVLLAYPNLVQHRELKSRIDLRRSTKRQSHCFIDNL